MPDPDLRFPVRSKAQVTWTPPAADPIATTWGWSYARHLIDERFLGRAKDPERSPTVSKMFWTAAGADVPNLALIPELRGAIFTPRRCPIDAEANLRPSSAYWVNNDWYDADTNPDEPWSLKYHESLGVQVALYSPSTIPADGGWLRTISDEPTNRSFYLTYHLMTPKIASGKASAAGINVYHGNKYGVEQWRWNFPLPNPDNDATNYWSLWRHETTGAYTLLDKIAQPYSGSSEGGAQSVTGWLMFIPLQDRIVVLNSRAPQAWIYADDPSPYFRQGFGGINIFGCRGWFNWGWCLYPSSATMQGPDVAYPEWISWQEENTEVRPLAIQATFGGVENTWCSYTGEYEVTDEESRTANSKVVIVNSSATDTTPGTTALRSGRRWTPIVYQLDEIHKTVLETPEEVPEDVDLSEYVLSLNVDWHETGRGATARLKLRNFDYDPETHTSSNPGVLDDQLLGMGKVSIALAHQYGTGADSDPTTVFTGYVSRIKHLPREVAGLWPALEVDLQDRASLWDDGAAVMMPLPSPSGWDFKEYVELLLLQWEVPAGDVVFPDDYTAIAVPLQEGGEAMRFNPDASITEALDRLCELAHYRWRVAGDGKVEFIRDPGEAGAADFTLDDTTTAPADRVFLPADATKDFSRVRTLSYVRGRDKLGYDREAYAINDPALSDTANVNYVGRHRGMWLIEEDNPQPGRTALRRLMDAGQLGREIVWRTVGRGLLPGDTVEVQISGAQIDVPAGTLFRVVGKHSELRVGDGGSLVWWDTYTGGLLPLEGSV